MREQKTKAKSGRVSRTLHSLVRIFVPHDKRFPKVINEFWYCGQWYMQCSKLHDEGREYRTDHVQWPVEGTTLLNPFQCGLVGFDDSRLIDGLVPAMRVGDSIGLYEITKLIQPESRFYDGASWDDGKKINLRFVKTIKLTNTPNEGDGTDTLD